MNSAFAQTKRVSWSSRLKNSVVGVLAGVMLIAGMVWLLFWNEGRTIREARSLAEGADLVVSVDSASVDPSNEGRLIHVTGPVTTSAPLFDPIFGVRAEGIRLVRNVEMYQWKEEPISETVPKPGGGEETTTTYSYSKAWSDAPQDSSRFQVAAGHENPPMQIRGQRFQLSEAKLGAFDMDERILGRIGGEQPVALTREQLTAIGVAFGGRLASLAENGAYIGLNPTAPEIGDYRISYTVAPLGSMSVVAAQAGGALEPYPTTIGNEILLVERGAVPAAQMFAAAQAENAAWKWGLRATGLFFLFAGFIFVTAPLSVPADGVPLLGSLLRLSTGLAALVLTTMTGAVTVAVAWFSYRPLLAIGVVALGLAITAAMVGIGRLGRPKMVAASKR
ncbi:MAG TPA: TMEM43 family protein [Rhizobiaceae bacterium]|nr:TMEM43 family protein [Rhizobiaceae bacterium]